MHSTTLEIDLAKNVFQLHGVDARGRAVLSRRVKRNQLVHTVATLPPCVIGMEAGGSAHHWGLAFEPLGHTVKLIHPKYVRPYGKTNKNDRRDAEAICEAVSRPTMRCVSIKTVEQAGEQGRRGIRRGHEQQDPRHAAAQLRPTRRGVPAPQSPHLPARPDMKSGRNHPLGKEMTHIPIHIHSLRDLGVHGTVLRRWVQECAIKGLRRVWDGESNKSGTSVHETLSELYRRSGR